MIYIAHEGIVKIQTVYGIFDEYSVIYPNTLVKKNGIEQQVPMQKTF